MPTIVHFDVPAENIERAANFYRQLFGWSIERLPGPMEYYGIMTTDEEGRPALGGGMGRNNEWDTGMMNYVGVSSIEETVARLIGLGGRVALPRTEVPGHGFLAVFIDTEGNRLGLWETAH
jgi:predicted enzyme related to lactoylglutathione lyase